RRQIHRYVDTHISESGLGAVEIAVAMGISVRHLHRLLLITGSTLGEYIRSRRLMGCRADLANPGMRQKTITDIAFFWGFGDSAHFSHAFRKQFGISPRAFRTRALARDWNEDNCLRDIRGPETADFHFEPN